MNVKPNLQVTWSFSLVVLVASGTFAAWAQKNPDIITDIRRDVRDDGMAEKLRLIERAYDEGDYDLALSLAKSIEGTLAFQKQLDGGIGAPQLSAAAYGKVDALPELWRGWAKGWSYYKVVALAEEAGIERAREPVDLVMSVAADQAKDLMREVRVARLDAATGDVSEVPSQVYDEVRRGAERQCHLVFYADAPASGTATYLVFYGNDFAELPEYPSELSVEGEGYGLNIATRHFSVSLSKQNGQLERIRYAREHGLELYAGGKGHGEAPTLDWSNDYVDEDHYQKLRIRNWAECPNFDVVKGPLCVRVRRWGFPHSPIYPLFTPSRMHIDQTYIFYADQEYFVKEGVMEAVKDFDISTMRDDEWVLSGYSFTNQVWFDSEGRFREGDVPAEQAQSLWGTGFYNRDSGDAFVALWLSHEIDGDIPLLRNGGLILHYHQHGQLWSRSPSGGEAPIHLKRGTTFSQRNAYFVSEYPKDDPAGTFETLRNRLRAPLRVGEGALPETSTARASGALARQGETLETAPLKPAIWTALADVWDEQLYKIDANAVDLGYIRDVKIRNGVAEILMTIPHRGRTVYQYLVYSGGGRNTMGIRERLLELDGIQDVVVRFTWDPPWTLSRLTDAGRRSMGLED